MGEKQPRAFKFEKKKLIYGPFMIFLVI